MAGGLWLVLVIPAILAFIFGAWVLYSVMVEASERSNSGDPLYHCTEGCQPDIIK